MTSSSQEDFKDTTDSVPVLSPHSPTPQDEDEDDEDGDDSKMEVIEVGGAWKTMVVDDDKDPSIPTLLPPPPDAELVELDLDIDSEPLQGEHTRLVSSVS